MIAPSTKALTIKGGAMKRPRVAYHDMQLAEDDHPLVQSCFLVETFHPEQWLASLSREITNEYSTYIQQYKTLDRVVMKTLDCLNEYRCLKETACVLLGLKETPECSLGGWGDT